MCKQAGIILITYRTKRRDVKEAATPPQRIDRGREKIENVAAAHGITPKKKTRA